MGLKFQSVIKSFYPKGKIWVFQDNFDKFIQGMAVEFQRANDDIKEFYDDFNIINSTNFAVEHSNDYLITQGLYSDDELQRIIVKYINGDMTFKEIITDFANYIDVEIEFIKAQSSIKFASSFAMTFGDPDIVENMQLQIDLIDNVTCTKYKKMVDIVDYFKPPYIDVFFTGKPSEGVTAFQLGTWQFGSGFGDISSCD